MSGIRALSRHRWIGSRASHEEHALDVRPRYIAATLLELSFTFPKRPRQRTATPAGQKFVDNGPICSLKLVEDGGRPNGAEPDDKLIHNGRRSPIINGTQSGPNHRIRMALPRHCS